jgi:protein-tyrosine kinase
MKIRKALEKAKKVRQEDGLERPAQASVAPLGKTREKWSPPVYLESRSVELDLKKLEENRCVGIFSDSLEVDFYKVLRTQILHRTRENGWNTVMITSTLPGEGKTLTSINLALTFAKEFNQTVLLVDCDLRRQSIHQYLGLPSDKGIIDYFMNGKSIKDLIIWPGIEKFSFISGGKTIQNSTEFLGSAKMKDLVTEMKTRYDDRYVLFDMPPILTGADAIAFTPMVDCILLVVEVGKTSIHDIKKALKLIPEDKFLGFVLNRQKSPMKTYYGNYYGKKQKRF